MLPIHQSLRRNTYRLKEPADKQRKLRVTFARLTATLILSCVAPLASGAPIPSTQTTEGVEIDWLKTIVSIEREVVGKSAQAVGTGFLLTTPRSHLVLVTARHVVVDQNKLIRTGLAYRLNRRSGSSLLFSESAFEHVAGNWFISQSADVACRFIATSDELDLASLSYSSLLPQVQVRPGAPLLVPGFPMGLRSEVYASPIVRRGIVALSEQSELLVDASLFPGNSGGPVFYVPFFKVAPPLQSASLSENRVIGLVSENISYVETAVSEQTGKARITFEQNAGLSVVIPADAILALLTRADVVAADEALGK